MAGDTIYLPKQPVRPGMKHSYQSSRGIKVVAVDPEKQRADVKARNRAAGRKAQPEVVSTDGE